MNDMQKSTYDQPEGGEEWHLTDCSSATTHDTVDPEKCSSPSSPLPQNDSWQPTLEVDGSPRISARSTGLHDIVKFK